MSNFFLNFGSELEIYDFVKIFVNFVDTKDS